MDQMPIIHVDFQKISGGHASGCPQPDFVVLSLVSLLHIYPGWQDTPHPLSPVLGMGLPSVTSTSCCFLQVAYPVGWSPVDHWSHGHAGQSSSLRVQPGTADPGCHRPHSQPHPHYHCSHHSTSTSTYMPTWSRTRGLLGAATTTAISADWWACCASRGPTFVCSGTQGSGTGRGRVTAAGRSRALGVNRSQGKNPKRQCDSCRDCDNISSSGNYELVLRCVQ